MKQIGMGFRLQFPQKVRAMSGLGFHAPNGKSHKDFSQAATSGSNLAFCKKLLHKQDSCQYRKHGSCRMTRSIVVKAEYPKIVSIATNLIRQLNLKDMHLIMVGVAITPICMLYGSLQRSHYTPCWSLLFEPLRAQALVACIPSQRNFTIMLFYTAAVTILGHALTMKYEQFQLK